MSRIVFIGAGNVATQLAIAFTEKGQQVIQIFSKTEGKARILADKLSCPYTTEAEQITAQGDIYILAVNDDEIENVAKLISLNNQLIVHTSGSVAMKTLKDVSENHGVFWPLQTLTSNKKADFSDIPVCIEASNSKSAEILQQLAGSITQKVHEINSPQRKVIHVAAVFACNFSNQMFAIAEDILTDEGISFDMLKPLIAETIEKIKEGNPAEMQTGPAIRGDKATMDEHLRLLENSPVYQKIYTLVSQSITNNKRNEH